MDEPIAKILPASGTCTTMSVDQKIEVMNAAPGELKGLDCPVCNNKGYVAFEKDGVFTLKECICMARRASLRRMKKSGLSGLLSLYTFSAYETPEPWQKTAKETAKRFVQEWAGQWFVITGAPGTGKTHLCTAIAAALMRQSKDVQYMLWRDEAPRLKALVNERDGYEPLMDEFKYADVLYIDDFFKGDVTAADRHLAFELINARYIQPRKVTLISSEHSIEELLNIDEAIGSRIYERSKGFRIKTPKQNWRLKGADNDRT